MHVGWKNLFFLFLYHVVVGLWWVCFPFAPVILMLLTTNAGVCFGVSCFQYFINCVWILFLKSLKFILYRIYQTQSELTIDCRLAVVIVMISDRSRAYKTVPNKMKQATFYHASHRSNMRPLCPIKTFSGWGTLWTETICKCP